MKKILNIILLSSILCLVGCSKDVPQKVEFVLNEIEIPHIGKQISVDVIANCEWNISSNSQDITILEPHGEGDSHSIINIKGNFSYDKKEHILVVTSQDGSSTDFIYLKQNSLYALNIQEPSLVNEEGGEFDIQLETNDTINDVKVPQWVSIMSGRGLKGCTYSFFAEPNETRQEREGEIIFKGSNTGVKKINIKQDSYSPKFVNGINSQLIGGKGVCPLSIEPEFADWSKLSIPKNNTFWLDGHSLYYEAKSYGFHNLKIMSKDNVIMDDEIEIFPKHPIRYMPDELHYSQVEEIYFDYYSPEYITTSSNESVIKVLDGKNIKAVGFGEATITTKHPNLDIESSCHFVVKDIFLVEARVSQMTQLVNNAQRITISIYAKIPKGTTNVCYNLYDNYGYLVDINSVCPNQNEDNIRLNTPKLDIQGSFNQVRELLKSYSITMIVTFGGKDYTKEIRIIL